MAKRRLLLTLLFFFSLTGPVAWAQDPVGPEFQVNSYTTNNQVIPAVASDANGNFVVVWQSPRDGSGYGVFGQRFNASGIPQGSEFQVGSSTGWAIERYPAVASDTNGNFVVVWQSSLDGSGYGVFGQRFDASGIPQGSEFQVNSYTTGDQYRPAVASDGNGNFVVVWNSHGQDGSVWGIFGQRFNAAGAPEGSEFQVNSYTTGNQSGPAVASDPSGSVVVVWESDLQDGAFRGIFGQRFNASGLPQGGEFQVNSYTTDGQYGPAVACDASGNVVVVWQSYGQDASAQGVFGQRFNASGIPQGGEFQVNSYTTLTQSSPAVASDANGNFVVAWSSYLQDGSGLGVFGQRFNASGLRQGAEFQVNSYTTSHQALPGVASDANGSFVVAWSSGGQDGSGGGVFGQRFGDLIFRDGFE